MPDGANEPEPEPERQRERGADAERHLELRLVDGLRAGDVAAFDRAYGLYSARVFSFLLRLSARRDTAEDLAQETWIKLAKAAPTLHEDTRLGPLLFTIARNAFVSYRRWAMLDLSRLVILGWSAASTAPAPDEEHERAAELVRLDAALMALPVAHREVLLLVGVEELSHEDAARVLDVSAEALRQRLHRARAQLAEEMARLSRDTSADSKPRARRVKGESP